jgi:uncharacterized protein (DUF1778 family)
MTAANRAGRTDTRDVNINLRASQQTKDLIDAAATAVGKSRSEFMLDSARQKAEDVLLDQRLFMLDDAKYQAFVRILESPPKKHDALRKLLADKAPWET